MKKLHNVAAAMDAGTAAERLFELAARLGEMMDGWLTERGLTRARAELLWRLHQHGPMTQRELSQALRCSPRNVTGLIDALQAAGLVARQPHPTDRRATLAALTARGTATATEMQASQQEGARLLFADIRPADLTRFVTTLERVLARLPEAPPATSVQIAHRT
jgi:DNA-binding MarR family transcriptional regulator